MMDTNLDGYESYEIMPAVSRDAYVRLPILFHSVVHAGRGVRLYFSDDDGKSLFDPLLGAEASADLARQCLEFLRVAAPEVRADILREAQQAEVAG